MRNKLLQLYIYRNKTVNLMEFLNAKNNKKILQNITKILKDRFKFD